MILRPTLSKGHGHSWRDRHADTKGILSCKGSQASGQVSRTGMKALVEACCRIGQGAAHRCRALAASAPVKTPPGDLNRSSMDCRLGGYGHVQ
jgi:hypothetical protein